MMRFAVFLLYVPMALCQDFDRVFRLTGTPDQSGQQEIATSLKIVAQISKLSIDQTTAALTIHASANQVALAEWLVPRLDHPPAAPEKYNVAGNKSDIVMVLPLAYAKTPRSLQEVITTMRTVLDLRSIYNISSASMLVLRGTAADIAKVDFLIPELDAGPQIRLVSAVKHFEIGQPFRDYDTLTAYHLAHANSNLAIEEILTNLRTVTDIAKIYTVTSNATLAMCANQSDTQAAEWLAGRLDRDAGDTDASPFKMPNGKDDVIQVLYLSHLTDSKSIAPLGSSFRSASGIKRVYWMTVPAAVAVRGTADAVAAVARQVKQADVAE